MSIRRTLLAPWQKDQMKTQKRFHSSTFTALNDGRERAPSRTIFQHGAWVKRSIREPITFTINWRGRHYSVDARMGWFLIFNVAVRDVREQVAFAEGWSARIGDYDVILLDSFQAR
jgi:hypothetical protein